jgi:hypothetical protein
VTVCPFLSSACSPDLLHVILDTFGHVDMYDAFQMGEIKPHAQSDRRHYNFNVSKSKFIEGFGLLFIGESGVIDGD